MLEVPSVASARDAVRAAIVSEVWVMRAELLQWSKRLTFERWIHLAQTVILAIAMVAALIQLNRLDRTIGDNTWVLISNQTMEVGKVFVDNPHLQPYFYNGLDIRSDDEKFAEVDAMASLLLDYFDNIALFTIGSRADSTQEPRAWRRYFEDVFRNSPMLCRKLFAEAEWYGKDIRRLGFRVCREPRRSN